MFADEQTIHFSAQDDQWESHYQKRLLPVLRSGGSLSLRLIPPSDPPADSAEEPSSEATETGLSSKSDLDKTMRHMFEHRPDSERLYVFGDSAYTGSYATIGCYNKPRGRQLTERQRQFNREMSSTRVSVEHGYGRIQNLWQSQGFHLRKRMGSTPVAAYYLAAVLLTNLMTCLRGHQISVKFNCKSISPVPEITLIIFTRCERIPVY